MNETNRNLNSVERARLAEKRQAEETVNRKRMDELELPSRVCKAVVSQVESLNHDIKGYFRWTSDDGYGMKGTIYETEWVRSSIEEEEKEIIYNYITKPDPSIEIRDWSLKELDCIKPGMDRERLVDSIRKELRKEGLQGINVRIDTLTINKHERYETKAFLGIKIKDRTIPLYINAIYVECRW